MRRAPSWSRVENDVITCLPLEKGLEAIQKRQKTVNH